jgi:hypothetical protein
MLSKIKSLWRSTKKEDNTTTQEQPKQLQGDWLLSHLYRNINETPLSVFIAVSCDGNLKALIKPTHKEEVPESLLLNTWQELSAQYSEQMGDHEQKMFLTLFKEINKITATIHQVHLLVDVLRKYHVDEFTAELNKTLHTKFKFDYRFPEDYDRDLNRCLKRVKELDLRLEIKRKDFEVLSAKLEKQNNNARPGREYFIRILMTLSDYAKRPITEDITVYEFVARIKALHRDGKSK